MAVLTIRSVPEHVHRALRSRAARNGRSTEAEVRQILAESVAPGGPSGIGEALAAIGRDLALSDEDIDRIEAIRDRAAATPLALP
ncbi:MAG: Arc family DNA-binding protein [Bifidobacteriaceae bacterium]|jgi:plasmid stability protein|nr:Arc family DNA-binding protein [Bifidobacteriaceae bacterium]